MKDDPFSHIPFYQRRKKEVGMAEPQNLAQEFFKTIGWSSSCFLSQGAVVGRKQCPWQDVCGRVEGQAVF